MMFQMVYRVSRDELVIHCALEELVERQLKSRIMMVRLCSKCFLVCRLSRNHLAF